MRDNEKNVSNKLKKKEMEIDILYLFHYIYN